MKAIAKQDPVKSESELDGGLSKVDDSDRTRMFRWTGGNLLSERGDNKGWEKKREWEQYYYFPRPRSILGGAHGVIGCPCAGIFRGTTGTLHHLPRNWRGSAAIVWDAISICVTFLEYRENEQKRSPVRKIFIFCFWTSRLDRVGPTSVTI